MNPLKEITNKRPTNYSRWHRSSLPEWCYLTDGDWFEQRKSAGELQTVAYIETLAVPALFVKTGQHNYKLWPSKEALLKDIHQRMRVPCFVVRHTSDCDLFSVARFTRTGEAEAIIMRADTYKNFILELKPAAPTHPCTICKSTDWWRSDSQWGPGEWLCNICHPNPNPAPKEVEVLTNTKMHRPYRLQDGTFVPSVTTALNVLNKGEQLQDWIWECGRQGVDYREIRDAAARVGTLAHYLITCHLKGETPDTSEYSMSDIEKAKSCLAKYQRWESEHPLSPVMIETPLVSEEFKYGGTPDLLAELDGEFVLIDFKTGGGIYESMFYQLAAYQKLLEEQGWPVANAQILRISPDDDDFEVAIRIDLDRDWQIFQHSLAIYKLQD